MKNQTHHINPQQVTKLLTRSTEHLDAQILSSLSQARAVALQKQRQTAPVFSLSAVGHHAHHLLPHSTQQWVAMGILIAALIAGGVGYWQGAQAPVDLDILTDDLPIEVFVDQTDQ